MKKGNIRKFSQMIVLRGRSAMLFYTVKTKTNEEFKTRYSIVKVAIHSGKQEKTTLDLQKLELIVCL